MQTTAGWSNLGGRARKFHYFESAKRGTMALCGRWMIWQQHIPLEVDTGKATGADCVACTRKLGREAAPMREEVRR